MGKTTNEIGLDRDAVCHQYCLIFIYKKLLENILTEIQVLTWVAENEDKNNLILNLPI